METGPPAVHPALSRLRLFGLGDSPVTEEDVEFGLIATRKNVPLIPLAFNEKRELSVPGKGGWGGGGVEGNGEEMGKGKGGGEKML